MVYVNCAFTFASTFILCKLSRGASCPQVVGSVFGEELDSHFATVCFCFSLIEGNLGIAAESVPLP